MRGHEKWAIQTIHSLCVWHTSLQKALQESRNESTTATWCVLVHVFFSHSSPAPYYASLVSLCLYMPGAHATRWRPGPTVLCNFAKPLCLRPQLLSPSPSHRRATDGVHETSPLTDLLLPPLPRSPSHIALPLILFPSLLLNHAPTKGTRHRARAISPHRRRGNFKCLNRCGLADAGIGRSARRPLARSATAHDRHLIPPTTATLGPLPVAPACGWPLLLEEG